MAQYLKQKRKLRCCGMIILCPYPNSLGQVHYSKFNLNMSTNFNNFFEFL